MPSTHQSARGDPRQRRNPPGAQHVAGGRPAIMEPHAGILGGMPRPRKLKDDSMTIMLPIRSVPSTSIELAMFGKISRRRMAASERPRALAASTYSRFFSAIISALASL